MNDATPGARPTSSTPLREPPPTSTAPRIWDLPLRLFHWALAVAVGVSLYTGLVGGFELMDWHQRSGFVVLGLLLFRLVWGFAGTRHARFAAFLRGPRTVTAWTRGALARRPPATAGHNPLAGWAIVVLLLALAVQAFTGLFASDDLFTEGPLVHLVEDDTSSLATRIHGWGQWTVGVLVGIHLLALVVHRIAFGDRLVGPMITGRQREAEPVEGIDRQRLPLAVLVGAAAATLVWYVVERL